MSSLVHDARFGLRKLRRMPGYTAIAVATIGIAIGATTAIFSIVDSVLLRPLPYRDPSRLVFVESVSPDGNAMTASPADLIDYRNLSHSFTGLTPVQGGGSSTLTRPGLPAVRLNRARVGADFFSLLGVAPERGRGFVSGEDSASATKVAVLSDLAWRRYFGGDPGVVGASITLSDVPYRVVGIAPPRFSYPSKPDVWIPAVWRRYEVGDQARGLHEMSAIGRLRPGATVASARRDIQAIAARIAHDFPNEDARIGAYLAPLADQLVGDVRPALWSLLGAVALVLLIACANVANLSLVRGASRSSEIAVRTALGAARWQLIRQLVTESLLVSLAGAVIGVILAAWAVDLVVSLGPHGLPRLSEIVVNGRMLAFAAALAVATGLLFGLLPAFHATRADVSPMLRERQRGSSGGGTTRTRSLLIISETALAMVLLVGAGLLIRSFERLTHVDPGFRADQLYVFDIALSGKTYNDDAPSIRYAEDVEQRLAALPGTEYVAVAAGRPLDPDPTYSVSTSFTVDGEPKPEKGREPESVVLPVSPSYFRTIGLGLVSGRAFTDAENRLDAAPVVVVNEALVRRYFPSQNPIGTHIAFDISHTPSASDTTTVTVRGEIVGIVRDTKQESLSETTAPATYVPYNTFPLGATFLVRSQGAPAAVERGIAAQVQAVDPNVAMYELGSMADAMAESTGQPLFYTLLLGAFALMALLLATLGIYGVIAYLVTERTRELGIRIALGATSRAVERLVVWRGLALALAGIATGALGAVGATRGIRSLLFGVAPLDVPTFVAVGLVLAAVAAAASWLPARRAARIDPVIAMRAE
ncbi:MAG TPA: ABC transporter permease [Gemmatimonadaceae bacterium]|nr:ABC transporter permease [Gemmatimonadaceae bacterium]